MKTNLTTIFITGISWTGIAILFIILFALLATIIIPCSPIILCVVLWKKWAKPFGKWWGTHLQHGTRMMFGVKEPNLEA